MRTCEAQKEESLLKFYSWFHGISVIVNLFFMFALTTPIQSPFALGKFYGGYKAGQKSSFPQGFNNLNL